MPAYILMFIHKVLPYHGGEAIVMMTRVCQKALDGAVLLTNKTSVRRAEVASAKQLDLRPGAFPFHASACPLCMLTGLLPVLSNYTVSAAR